MTRGRRAADEPSLGLLLFIPYRAMETRALARLAEHGFDLTAAQAKVMQRIGPDGTRLTDLAAAAQVTKQTAGFLVDQLERARFVRRMPDPSDARARLVTLAERGLEAAAVAAREVAAVEAEWEDHLGSRQLQQVRAALSRLRDLTDPYQ